LLVTFITSVVSGMRLRGPSAFGAGIGAATVRSRLRRQQFVDRFLHQQAREADRPAVGNRVGFEVFVAQHVEHC
jgi:hypothetical protein